jgi:uncharacterized protein HemX
VNLLIMGGLIVVAAAAIIGAILLAIGEQRAEKAHANGAAAAVTKSMNMPASVTSNQSNSNSRTAPIRQSAPVTIDRSFGTRGDDQSLSTLNGQFHELASELRTLYQHAWELEQHLRVLTEAVDRIEQSQEGHFSIAEEAHARPSGDGSQL